MDKNFQELIEKASQGDVDAMCMVGDCYNRGLYTEKNDKQSHYYYQMAADKGHTHAELITGIDYLNGIGVQKDTKLAQSYLQKAADKGLPEAQHLLALMYQSGSIGFWGKDKKAISYFEMAAKQGHAASQILLAKCYWSGSGVKSNLENCLFWLSCAYLHGNSAPEASNEAQEILNMLITDGVPGGRNRIDKIMETIKIKYPSYYNQET